MPSGGLREGAGRKQGSKANHTVLAEAAKAALIQAYLENIVPINQALVKKAKEGDIQAIKEIHDRAWGKPNQDITSKGERLIPIPLDAIHQDNSIPTDKSTEETN